MSGTRPPTVEEAVRVMKSTLTEEQKKLNLAFWLDLCGPVFVAQVVRSLKK